MHQGIPVIDDPSIARDPSSGAIINVDMSAFEQHQRRKKARQSESERLTKLEADMQDIKSLLMQLVSNETREQK